MIEFNSQDEFFQFVHYATVQGLVFKAVERGGLYTVTITGY